MLMHYLLDLLDIGQVMGIFINLNDFMGPGVLTKA